MECRGNKLNDMNSFEYGHRQNWPGREAADLQWAPTVKFVIKHNILRYCVRQNSLLSLNSGINLQVFHDLDLNKVAQSKYHIQARISTPNTDDSIWNL